MAPNDDEGHDASSHSRGVALLSRRQILQGMNATALGMGMVGSAPAARSAVATADGGQSGAAARLGPRKVRHIENVWITMSDGTRLAARVWLPEDADQKPVPAIMEYIPYRKRDSMRLRDESTHAYLASFGYACIRPDIRGSGDSEGPVQDEYVKQEQDDAMEIIAWLTAQPWCTGKVGMFGISWGGFSALQVAARRPPGLAAIITHCSTDDRYTDDAHYVGGCINESMSGSWGSDYLARSPRPPDPAIVGPRWREIWRERLESLEFFAGTWLEHQHRDAYWKQGSINEDYSRIQCPVYVVGGWADPYVCTLGRMLANLSVPRKGLCGPWAHQYPHEVTGPGPAIDWLTEALRWWDHWLKGIDTGLMREPMYRAWMQHETAFQGTKNVPGRWVAEEAWPSPRIRPLRMHLTPGGLQPQAASPTSLKLSPVQTVGATARWYSRVPAQFPGDQRVDDARSLVFDSAPLDRPFEILGVGVVEVDVSVDKPVASLFARLCEVTPDNVSRRITWGVLNLCHRESHESPTPLEPGKRYRIRLPLRDIAHAFKAGSRVRIALATSHWPTVWPSPEPVTLTVHLRSSTLELPVRPPRPQDEKLAPFGPGFIPETHGATDLVPGGDLEMTHEWDVATRTLTVRSEFPYRRSRLNETGTELYSSWRESFSIREDDPTSASIEFHRMYGMYRPDWDHRIEAVLKLTMTRDTFFLDGDLRTFESGKPFWSRRWQRPIPRRLV
jgi:putative CocE/NonD family hydrolase